MRKVPGEIRPAIDFQEQVGDLEPGKHSVCNSVERFAPFLNLPVRLRPERNIAFFAPLATINPLLSGKECTGSR
jgi:hypothetical protein